MFSKKKQKVRRNADNRQVQKMQRFREIAEKVVDEKEAKPLDIAKITQMLKVKLKKLLLISN